MKLLTRLVTAIRLSTQTRKILLTKSLGIVPMALTQEPRVKKYAELELGHQGKNRQRPVNVLVVVSGRAQSLVASQHFARTELKHCMRITFNRIKLCISEKPSDERQWPGGTVCTTPDGDKITDFDHTTEMPEGTVCAEPCDMPYHDYETWQYDSSTCECDHSSGRCGFTNRKVNSCILKVRIIFNSKSNPLYRDENLKLLSRLVQHQPLGYSASSLSVSSSMVFMKITSHQT